MRSAAAISGSGEGAMKGGRKRRSRACESGAGASCVLKLVEIVRRRRARR
jgi:hypothetical protein